MPINFQDSGSRSASRAKRRKTNIILNSLITIVVLLILVIGWKVFFSDNNPGEDSSKQTANQEAKNDDDSSSTVDDPEDNSIEGKQENNETNNESAEDIDEAAEDENDGELIENDSDEANVEKVIINPAWKPIGTEQTSGHESSYSRGTVDWNEKLAAAAYAIDTTVDNMTAWWVTGGQPPEQQAILTVSAKGASDTYRVMIEWVDGEGWKPVEMKKLIENDKGQY